MKRLINIKTLNHYAPNDTYLKFLLELYNLDYSNNDKLITFREKILSVFAVIAHEASDALYKDRWNGISLPKYFLHLTGNVTGSEFSFNCQ